MRTVYHWINNIQSSVYPPTCTLCGSEAADNPGLCPACWHQLPHNHTPCQYCALPLPAGNRSGICGRCASSPPVYQRAYAPFLYQQPIDHLITRFKFAQQLALGRLLGKLLADYLLAQQYAMPQLILPVPLHAKQLRERGFNQSAELALHLSRELDLDWSAQLLKKIRPTQPQHGLNRRQRRMNLRHSFAFNNTRQLSHVALVDDVLTTGSTATEISRLLQQQGIQRVQLWTVARTP